jgi:immunity protein 35 of polymorphic toxin system
VITESDARRIAEAELASPHNPAVITHVFEEERGWEFHWDYAAYVETGDRRFSVIGGGPILVSRQDGSIIAGPPLAGTIPTNDPGVVAIEAKSLRVPRKRAE